MKNTMVKVVKKKPLSWVLGWKVPVRRGLRKFMVKKNFEMKTEDKDPEVNNR